MKKILSSGKVYVADSQIPNGGRGVFAAGNIKKGELIETCPVIKISEEDPSNTPDGILITYFYYLGKKKQGQFLALGFGSIYNHTRNPNAQYKINQKEEIIDFTALCDIKKDSEITVNYNYANPKDKNPMWFE